LNGNISILYTAFHHDALHSVVTLNDGNPDLSHFASLRLLAIAPLRFSRRGQLRLPHLVPNLLHRGPDLIDLVLEQIAKRLNQVESKFRRQGIAGKRRSCPRSVATAELPQERCEPCRRSAASVARR
jgi:hypothetical protein